ncbi:PAS domain S-box protein [Halovenus marina]|uniref:PAS domain S-box protein n=1 Tax=Halovenus marina TaxID=3396621 RepID=UPI003F564210
MVGTSSAELAIRVLIIEQSVGETVSLASQLTVKERDPLAIESVSDLETAWSVLSEKHVDCVICQHDPPAIDGVEILTALREAHPDLPILLATETTHADGALDSAATDVLPVSDGALHSGIVVNRIRAIVSQARELGTYEQIFDQANDGIVVHDPDTGDILEANRRFYEILGYDPTEDELMLGDIAPEIQEYTEDRARQLVTQAAEDGGQTVEWLVQTATGDERWMEVSHRPVTLSGIDRVLAFVRDITERKENERLLRDREQQLEAVFNHPASFVVVLDASGRVVRTNQTALEYVDSTQSDIEGVAVWEGPWWEEDDAAAERVRSAVERATARETARLEVELGGETVERRHLDLQFEPVRDEDTTSGCVIAGYDITERRDSEQEAREERETLRRLHEITSNPDLTLTEQIQHLLDFGTDRFDLDIAFLARIDADTDYFEIVEARGDHPLIQSGNESDLAETYCRRTIDVETESPLAIQTAADEMAGDPAFEKYGLGCYLGAEIVVDGEPYGTLCFADEHPRDVAFSSEERTLVDLMAQWLRRDLEQREYRREIEAARDRFEQTIERIDDGFFAVDDEWQITYVNGTGANILRQTMGADYDDEELLGRHLWEEIPDAVGTPFYERYHEALETQNTITFEEHYEPLDVWFEVRAHPDEDGLSVYFTDITERKERQRELRRLQDLLEQTEHIADVGGWEIDIDTMEVFWSDNLFDLLGEDDEEPSLDDALDIYLDEDRPIVERAVESAVESREPFDVEARYRRSGDVRWLRVQGVPIVDDGGVVTIRGAAQDITERKEHEQTLNDLLDATQAFIRASDRDELVAAITDGIETVFGYEISSVRLHDPESGTLPPSRLSAAAAERVTDPPTYDDEESVAGETFQSGEPTVIDDLSTATDHDYDSIDSAMFFPIAHYGVLGVGATDTDAFRTEDVALINLLTTSAANAFDRLEQETEMRYLQRIIDRVDVKVFLLDEHGQFAHVTDPLAAYLGREADELAGTQLTDIVVDGDSDVVETAFEDAISVPHESCTVEVGVRTGGGETRPVELELSPIEESSTVAAIAGVVTDISELAKTRSTLVTERERFQELFENLPDPVVEVKFVDRDPIVQYVNPAFVETFGYGRDGVQGANLNDLIVPGGERESATTLDERALGGEETSAGVKRETPDGRRDFLLRGFEYTREEDSYGFAVYTDITEQKERERYLQVLNRVLRHNLRNDMNVVMALAKRLAENIEDEELAEYAATLENNAREVATLSEKAKEIERVLGRRASETGVVDATAHLRELTAEKQTAYPDADFVTDLPDELWLVANENIKRACEELVENAIEHNERARPRLAISARDVDQDGWVELSFHDNGPGIPDDEWQIVTGEEEITQLSHGSGLGLWLIRWIVESYGGEIYREQRAGEDGTRIVLRLRQGEPESYVAEPEHADST